MKVGSGASAGMPWDTTVREDDFVDEPGRGLLRKVRTILAYAKADLTDSGETEEAAKETWNEKVLPYIKGIAEQII